MKLKAAVLIVTLALGLLAAPLPAEAQKSAKVYRIGWLSSRPGIYIPYTLAFLGALRDLGWVDGENIVVEYRAEGNCERLANFATELVKLKVDVIVASNTPSALAAKKATTTIPIVMVQVADPVGSGLVASLERPGGNATGVVNIFAVLARRQVELLKETVPGLSRVAVLWDPTQPGNAPIFKQMQVAARALNVVLQPLEVRDSSDFETIFSAMRKKHAEALIVLASTLIIRHYFQIGQFVLKHQLPTISNWTSLVQAGGLMSYTPDWPALYRQAATLVDKILRGRPPANLPVDQRMRYELTINLKTAKALGLTIPLFVLVRADKVIE